MKRTPITHQVRVKVYPVIETAVEHAVERGWHRAHKHDPYPVDADIWEQIAREVMVDLSEILDIDPEPDQ